VTRRLAAVAWLVMAAAVWSGFFDLYVSRGAREYLQLSAEFELGRVPEPSMTAIMAHARHVGAVAASSWALVLVAAGWSTIALAGKARDGR
jgi:hypothetical protein